MTQNPLSELVTRAKQAGLTMAEVCKDAGVAESTVSRAKRGSDMKLGTLRKLTKIVDHKTAAQPIAAE